MELHIEDSGPGIPAEKRDRLFAKFQESLDALSQGTGIGLAVCRNLAELMGADIWLDNTFDSGVEGCPGTRFILRLNQPAIDMEEQQQYSAPPPSACVKDRTNNNTDGNDVKQGADSPPQLTSEANTHGGSKYALPETLRVLVVDDDTMIRKMFRRAALRMAPNWDIEEACNGETALVICETKTFDVIFLDQYMASVEKQMLGTETARALRVNGVESIICGLSANDMGLQFLESGADTFMMKPFPCQKDAMAQAVCEVLQSRENESAGSGSSA